LLFIVSELNSHPRRFVAGKNSEKRAPGLLAEAKKGRGKTRLRKKKPPPVGGGPKIKFALNLYFVLLLTACPYNSCSDCWQPGRGSRYGYRKTIKYWKG
jgi:hypothetical protein